MPSRSRMRATAAIVLVGVLGSPLDLAAQRVGDEAVVEGVGIVDGLVADRGDDVTRLQAGTRCRAAAGHTGYDGTSRTFEIELFRQIRRHRLKVAVGQASRRVISRSHVGAGLRPELWYGAGNKGRRK